jgi:crotonobetainyl-CoA:carnitine CoA-transferase CaiB-like acyl-CoA transferase
LTSDGKGTDAAEGPLDGFTVVDFSENMAGPFGTMMLAEQGAEVIKVEPLRGDALRQRGTGSRRMGSYFANLNRSKRSLAVDLQREESRPILQRLLGRADVVVQSSRPAAAARLGIDAASVRRHHPSVVHASVVGYGLEGPLAGKPVYDHVIQAMSGMAALQAEKPGDEPRLTRHGLVDKATGLVLAQSVCAALLRRSRTTVGDELTITMLDVALSFFWPDAMMDLTALDPEVRLPSVADSFRLTPTLDGHIAMVVLTDRQWASLATAVGVTDASTGRGDLLRMARRRVAALSTADAVRWLHEHDIACGPVVPLEEVHLHPQVVANGSLGLFEHPVIGTLRQPNPVPDFGGRRPDWIRPAPTLGQHTAAILGRLGFSPDEIHTLSTDRVISTHDQPSPAKIN